MIYTRVQNGTRPRAAQAARAAPTRSPLAPQAGALCRQEMAALEVEATVDQTLS
eukprot:COSAG06_NODE_59612_length_273_cov_1.425287_1_plen_53_part_01